MSSTGGGTVYLVHATKPDDAGAVEIVFTTEGEARAYALDRSRDWRVVAVSVTRYVIAELGTRPGRLVCERGRAATPCPTAWNALPLGRGVGTARVQGSCPPVSGVALKRSSNMVAGRVCVGPRR